MAGEQGRQGYIDGRINWTSRGPGPTGPELWSCVLSGRIIGVGSSASNRKDKGGY